MTQEHCPARFPGQFEDAVREVDVVFDCVGGGTMEHSWPCTRKTGGWQRLQLKSPARLSSASSIDSFACVPTVHKLAQIGNLIDAGELRAFVEGVFLLAIAREAYARAHQGRMCGKSALCLVE